MLQNLEVFLLSDHGELVIAQIAIGEDLGVLIVFPIHLDDAGLLNQSILEDVRQDLEPV